jgi:hypothetical protein
MIGVTSPLHSMTLRRQRKSRREGKFNPYNKAAFELFRDQMAKLNTDG